MDRGRFQFRIVDLLLVTVVVALILMAAREGQIRGTAFSPLMLVLLAGLLGAITGRLVFDTSNVGLVGGTLFGVLGYLLAGLLWSLGIKIADKTLFFICVSTGGVVGGLIPVLSRWRRASVRIRMGILLVCFSLMVFSGFRWWTIHEQTRTVAELRAAGAFVYYADDNPLPMLFDSDRMESSSEWLRTVLGWRVVRRVYLTERVGHQYVCQLLANELPFVEDLQLHANCVDDGTFAFLNSGRLSKLDHLRFAGHGFDDASLARLQPLPGLVFLDLEGTSITDESIEHIISFPQLNALSVRHTNVTTAGVKRLSAKLGRVWSSN